jgi:hypothetical protein
MENYNPVTKGWLIYLGNSTYQTLFIDEIIKNYYTEKYNIDNFPTEEHLNNLTNVINSVYQPLCQYFGYKIPLQLSYISEELNTYLNVPYSNEMLSGLGLNINVKTQMVNLNNKRIFEYIKDNILFNKLIWVLGDDRTPDHIFVSYKQGDNDNEVLKLRTVGGKYEKFDVKPVTYGGLQN